MYFPLVVLQSEYHLGPAPLLPHCPSSHPLLFITLSSFIRARQHSATDSETDRKDSVHGVLFEVLALTLGNFPNSLYYPFAMPTYCSYDCYGQSFYLSLTTM